MAVTQVLGTDKALRLNNFNTLGLVQNFSWQPNFNAQDVFELGRTTRLDTLMELETSGSFELASSGNLAGLIARMKAKYNSGTGAFEGFEYAPTASGTGVNGYTFNQDDLAALKFDAVLHEKTEQKTFNRSVYLGCCYPTTLTGRVDTTGMAMDTVNWAGQFVVGFPSPYHVVRSVPATKASSSTLTLIDGAAYNTGWTLAYVTIDGIPYTTEVANPVYAAFSGGTITMSAGYTVPSGVVATAVFYKTTPVSGDNQWSAVHTPDTVGSGATAVFGVRGYQANVYIAPVNEASPVSSEQWLRVQSLDYSVDLRMEALRQVAYNDQGTTIYQRVPTYPLTMSVNATVMETDWADWKAMLTKSFTGSNVYDNVYDFAPENMKKEFAVIIDYFTKQGTKVQTVTFGDLRVDSMGSRVNVGGRGEITWSFRGSEFQVQGFNI
jgi:hypothetical protein